MSLTDNMRQWAAYVARGIQRRLDRLAWWVGDRAARIFVTLTGTPPGKPRICIWATALQANILALTHALADSQEVELLIAVLNVEEFLREPIQQCKPLSCRILERTRWQTAFAVRRFRADLAIVDDQLPRSAIAPRLMYLWHGLGMWKVKPRGEISSFVEHVRPHVGDVTRANPRFLAQSYGPTTYTWWIREWGFAPECCKQLGMAYSDWLLTPPYSRAYARQAIGLPERSGPTVLLSLSWHYGSRFGLWGDLADIAALVAKTIEPLNGQVLLCLHYRGFYDPAALERLYTLVRERENIFLRHKDQHPDNLADLLAADLMISNYSSFLGFFYVTGKPAIHLDPKNADGSMPQVASYMTGKREMHTISEQDVWLDSFDHHGGLAVKTPTELVQVISTALADPTCCRERSRQFLEEHVVGLDGNTGRRMVQEILAWLRP
jgi:hypothetical protein